MRNLTVVVTDSEGTVLDTFEAEDVLEQANDRDTAREAVKQVSNEIRAGIA